MKLTDKQQIFAKNIIDGMNQTEAAINAGYSKESAYSTASRMMKDAKILAYINFLRASVEEIFKIEAKKSLETIIALRDDKKTPHTVRLKACLEILDRAGYGVTHKVAGNLEHAHSGNVTTTHSKEMHIIEQIVNSNEEFADAIISAMRNQPSSIPVDDQG